MVFWQQISPDFHPVTSENVDFPSDSPQQSPQRTAHNHPHGPQQQH
jgi:hypothetical protein